MAQVERVYRPTLTDVSWAAQFRPATALIVGRPTEGLLGVLRPLGLELRTADGKFGTLLRRGIYAIESKDGWALVVVPAGTEGAPEEASDRDTSGHLANAVSVYEWWDDAKPLAGDCAFQVGDFVRARGERRVGMVTKTILQTHGYDVRIRLDGRQFTYAAEDLEAVEGDPDDPTFWLRDEPGNAEQMALTLSHTKLRYPLSDVFYSFASSKTLFRPYQFVPVIKLLNSPSGRLLIADEVGLGKTIEAGLIWTELEQREPLRRVLVLAPAALTHKWKAEMRRRFDRPVDIMTVARLREVAEELRQGRDEEFRAIMSMQALRGATDVLDILQEVNPHFDLVIVDEAHAMRNRGTSTHDLGLLLSDWADHLVFLSATPLNLGRQDLFNLVNLLDAEQFDDEAVFRSQLEPNRVLNEVLKDLAKVEHGDPRAMLVKLDRIRGMALGSLVTERPDFARLCGILDVPGPLKADERARAKGILNELNTLSTVFTRTRKVDVPDAKAEREAVQIDVEWTEAERAFYTGVRNLYLARAKARNTPVGFAMQMPLRQAASCIPAMQKMLGRADFDDIKIELLEDEDGEGPGLPAGQVEADVYQELMGLTQVITQDSKLEALRRRLLEARAHGMRQAMVFSFFKGTLNYLADQLRPDFSLQVLTGDTRMADREIVMDDFRAGKFELLLLSQVGSEGLDFEFCNVLVNYDLPWNPMQVEQRIGRLDRFGQRHEKIFIFNMHIPGTIETDIFERLYLRIGVFKESIGDLEPILRDELEEWTNELMDPNLTDAQRVQQADRIAVAIEQKNLQVQKLGESSALLSTPDALAIDGMTDTGPTDGRYIGQAEVHRMLDVLFRRYGGSITPADADGRAILRGTAELGSALSRVGRNRQGSMYSVQQLSALLRDEDRIPVTFVSDFASRSRIELISGRHPLVELAVSELDADPAALRRFGFVGVPELPKGRRYAVRVDLVRTTGIRPRTEIWATGVDLVTGERAEDVEGALLTALAEGMLRDIAHHALDVPLERLESLLSARRRQAGEQRAQDNVAMVEGRIQSRRQGITRKIHRAEAALSDAQAKGRDARIQRLHEGRIRNLRTEMEDVCRQLEERKALTVSHDPVAVLVVEGV